MALMDSSSFPVPAPAAGFRIDNPYLMLGQPSFSVQPALKHTPAFMGEPRQASLPAEGGQSTSDSAQSLVPEQPVWPDASTEFDSPPLTFPLRRSASEGNLNALDLIPTTLRTASRRSKSAKPAPGDASQSRRRKPKHTFNSAPVSPMNSRPTSPLSVFVSRSRRSSAEVLHDAQRAMIIGEELKAAEAARANTLPSGLAVCMPPERELPREIAAYVPRFIRVDLKHGANAAETAAQAHQRLLNGVVFGVRDSLMRSGLVACIPGDTPACREPLTGFAVEALGALRAASPMWRVLLVDLDLDSTMAKPVLAEDPSVLQIMLHGSTAPTPRTTPPSTNSHLIHVAWPNVSTVGDAEIMAVMRTLVIPMALSFAPDIVVFNASLTRQLSQAAYARITRALTGLAHGRLVAHVRVPRDNALAGGSLAACLGALLGLDVPLLPQHELCCDLATMSLLESIVAPLGPAWPCLNNTLSFRLLSEKQFCTVQGDDTVTATVALACLSMSSVREEDEDALVEGNRKRSLSSSVTGGAAALLKVRNSCSSPPP
eukprot:m.21321 g.21321  ORF g.21321 m.21321 type:complete len:544 (-) comp3615_c0_seq1:129-1760(-)